jgi:hypothetical protein
MEYIGKRISFVRKPEELSIVISAYSDKSKTNLLLAWFIAWTLGGLAIFAYLFVTHDNQVRTAIVVWLGFWIYFEYKVWKAYTWRTFGKEIIKIGKGKLFYKRDNRGQGKLLTCDTALIQNLEKFKGQESNLMSHFLNSYWVIAGETIAFNYYSKEILLGLQLENKDSAALLKLIQSELKA